MRRTGLFKRFERDEAGRTIVHYEERAARTANDGEDRSAPAR